MVQVATGESQVGLTLIFFFLTCTADDLGSCCLKQPNVSDFTGWVHPTERINLMLEKDVVPFSSFRVISFRALPLCIRNNERYDRTPRRKSQRWQKQCYLALHRGAKLPLLLLLLLFSHLDVMVRRVQTGSRLRENDAVSADVSPLFLFWISWLKRHLNTFMGLSRICPQRQHPMKDIDVIGSS